MTPAGGSPSKESIARIDQLVASVQALPDPSARAVAVELVQAVMSLHASALERMLEVVATSAPEAVELFAADDLVSSVLVLHGLHPDDFETRLARAIDGLLRFFDSRGAGIEVLDAGPEAVRVRFTGSRPGAGAAARRVIEDAIYEAAPEVGELIVEGVEEEPEAGFVPLASLLASQQA
jgi:hypothetical protein